MTTDIRTSKINLKYANKGKIETVLDYHFGNGIPKAIETLANNHLYDADILPKRPNGSLGAEITSLCGVTSSRQIQIIENEAASMVQSARNKIAKINPNTNQKYQQEILAKYKSKSLYLRYGNKINLDSRFISIDKRKNSSGKFDYFVKFVFSWSRAEKAKNKNLTKFVEIPIKETAHMRRLVDRGYNLKPNAALLHSNGVIEIFYNKEVKFKKVGNKLGADIGRNKAIVTSNNEIICAVQKLERIVRKKHGSKNQKKAVRAYRQYIDYSIRHGLNFDYIKELILEDLTNIKLGSRHGRYNHHWGHRYIQNRLALFALEKDVPSRKVHPAYTSQTCSLCGHVDRKNRNGEKFRCISATCGYEDDADHNAAINISRK